MATLVIDNGGASLKAGFSGQQDPLSYFPNATAKVKGERGTLIGDQILTSGNISALTLRRPIDRGYVVNWDLEKIIWERAFKTVLHGTSSQGCGLVVTEPLFNLQAIQSDMDQVVFEEFGFASYLPATGPELSMRAFAAERPDILANRALSGLIVDCGFSFTHVAPMFDGIVLDEGIRRIDIGGKALTNYLKELVSFRSVNMMEETFLVEHVKEVVSFVSQDLNQDLVAAKKGKHACAYVLPDGINDAKGYLRDPFTKEQIKQAAREGKEVPALQMNNERFMVPEVIFRPTDVGLEQAGLAETVVMAANAVHPQLRPLLFSNVICTGGTSACPGFGRRLAADLRALVPSDFPLEVYSPQKPSLAAWRGGSILGASPEYKERAYSRSDYFERGSNNMRLRREK